MSGKWLCLMHPGTIKNNDVGLRIHFMLGQFLSTVLPALHMKLECSPFCHCKTSLKANKGVSWFLLGAFFCFCFCFAFTCCRLFNCRDELLFWITVLLINALWHSCGVNVMYIQTERVTPVWICLNFILCLFWVVSFFFY